MSVEHISSTACAPQVSFLPPTGGDDCVVIVGTGVSAVIAPCNGGTVPKRVSERLRRMGEVAIRDLRSGRIEEFPATG